MSREAKIVVDALLDDNAGPHRRIPVRVRRGGQTLDAEFTGYYSPQHMSVGYPVPGQAGFSHGILGKEDQLETPVPSYDEWEIEREAAEKERLAAQQPPPAAAAAA
ncbi:MAG: hypothetical protein ACOYB3_00485 [Azonexus sp.]